MFTNSNQCQPIASLRLQGLFDKTVLVKLRLIIFDNMMWSKFSILVFETVFRRESVNEYSWIPIDEDFEIGVIWINVNNILIPMQELQNCLGFQVFIFC